MKIFNWDKPRTLYRYLKSGDLFCYQIAEDLFGYGRIIAKNKLGTTAEFFDKFTEQPVVGFDYNSVNTLSTLFKCIIDAPSEIDAKLTTEWRVIAQDPDYQNPNPDEITSINAAMQLEHNADFSIQRPISQDEAVQKIRANYELKETPHSHFHVLSLLIRYKPDLFQQKKRFYLKADNFVPKEFKEIHNKELTITGEID